MDNQNWGWQSQLQSLEGRDKKILEAHWLASLAESGSFRLTEKPSQKMQWAGEMAQ